MNFKCPPPIGPLLDLRMNSFKIKTLLVFSKLNMLRYFSEGTRSYLSLPVHVYRRRLEINSNMNKNMLVESDARSVKNE